MRLALAVGRLDVDALMRELTSRQLAEWDAFDRLEGGIGARAGWYQAAELCALYAERNRDRKKRAAPFTASDFLPWIEKPQMTPKAFRAQFAHLVVQKKRKG